MSCHPHNYHIQKFIRTLPKYTIHTTCTHTFTLYYRTTLTRTGLQYIYKIDFYQCESCPELYLYESHFMYYINERTNERNSLITINFLLSYSYSVTWNRLYDAFTMCLRNFFLLSQPFFSLPQQWNARISSHFTNFIIH